MINEGRGISDLNKEETENIFNIFKDSGYSKFTHQILNRSIEITFTKGNYDSKFYKNDITSNGITFLEFNNILIKNKVSDFLDFIEKNINTSKYIDCWFKIIRSNINKFLKKQENIIKEVIEDVNLKNNYTTEYPTNEQSILRYTEYLNENLKNKL